MPETSAPLYHIVDGVVLLYCEITFHAGDHPRGFRVGVLPCAEIETPEMAEVCIPHDHDSQRYGITCYLMQYPHEWPAVAESLFLRDNSVELFTAFELNGIVPVEVPHVKE